MFPNSYVYIFYQYVFISSFISMLFARRFGSIQGIPGIMGWGNAEGNCAKTVVNQTAKLQHVKFYFIEYTYRHINNYTYIYIYIYIYICFISLYYIVSISFRLKHTKTRVYDGPEMPSISTLAPTIWGPPTDRASGRWRSEASVEAGRFCRSPRSLRSSKWFP